MSAERRGWIGISANKILVIFGSVACAVTIPLIVLYFWFPSMLGNFTGLVENIIVGMLGGVLITVVLTIILNRIQQKATEKVARVALSETSVVINHLMAIFGEMVKASSDGFIPSTADELLGDKATKLISLHLHVEKPFYADLNIVWLDYIASEFEKIKNNLFSLLSRYAAFLSEDVLAELAALGDNQLVRSLAQSGGEHQMDVIQHISRPVLNIPFDQLRPLMAEILVSVKTVEREALKLNARKVVQFPQFTFRDDVAPKIGSARYEGSPGPPTFLGQLPDA